MLNFIKIAVNAFRESVREPVYFLMLLAAVLLIANLPPAALFVMDDQLKLVVDSAMATGLLFGMVAAVLCASHTVAREMRNGTVLLLLSKPVFRWVFIVGKLIGILAAVTVFIFICNSASVVSVYVATDQFHWDSGLYGMQCGVVVLACVAGMVVNFWRGGSFPEISVYWLAALMPLLGVWCLIFRPAPYISMADFCKALVLIQLAAVIMGTFATAFAVRADVIANLVLCSCMFFLGMVSSYLYARLIETMPDSQFLHVLFGALYALLPNWQYFWLADAIASGQSIPASYLAGCAFYTLIYIGMCTMWAVALFQNREAAGDVRV